MRSNFAVFKAIPLRISPEDVLKQLGYPHETCVPSKMRKKVETEIVAMLRLIEPKGAYRRLEGGGQAGFELFARAERIILALVTIGSALEQTAKKLVETGQALSGLTADAVGTIAAERTANFVEHQIHRESTRCGWKVSRRYAPGHCGWELEAQKELFRNFPDTLGIKLTTGCLMIPEKSLSFVCLLSSNGNFGGIKAGDCKTCEQDVCPYRREANIRNSKRISMTKEQDQKQKLQGESAYGREGTLWKTEAGYHRR